MDAEFPDSLVAGYEGLIESLDLPDPDDRHVLAAAITCHAHVVVTANLRDFPKSSLSHFSVAAQHPDDFLLDQLDLHSDSSRLIALAVCRHKSALTESKPTWKQYFEFMARDSVLPKTHAALTTPRMKVELKNAIEQRPSG